MRFSVEYNPSISKNAERLIRAEITPSMTSEDGDSSQYPIDFVLESLEAENQDEVFNQDIAYLKQLSEEDVAYIEI
jgi:BioD-like phosphotransacetylase family protein